MQGKRKGLVSLVVAQPIACSDEGLPIGAQLLVGRRWRDNELLDVAAAITEVAGGFQRPPGYDSVAAPRGSLGRRPSGGRRQRVRPA